MSVRRQIATHHCWTQCHGSKLCHPTFQGGRQSQRVTTGVPRKTASFVALALPKQVLLQLCSQQLTLFVIQHLCCSREQELTAQVTKYFHSDGYLDGPSFSRDVQKLLLSMQARLASKIQ